VDDDGEAIAILPSGTIDDFLNDLADVLIQTVPGIPNPA
jgi:hypothetical protein